MPRHICLIEGSRLRRCLLESCGQSVILRLSHTKASVTYERRRRVEILRLPRIVVARHSRSTQLRAAA